MTIINTNYQSLMAQNSFAKSQGALSTAMQRLTTGLRVNSAMDDAAGLAIANRFTASIRGLTAAARNAGDAISMSQTAEGALSEINSNLQRIRELTVQGKNPTNSASDVQSLQEEINARLEEIDRVAKSTDFNGVKILNGGSSGTTFSLQVGSKDGEVIKYTVAGNDIASLGVNNFQITRSNLSTLDSALAKVDSARAGLGAIQNRFQSTITTLNNTVANLSAARSRIEDADYAVEVSAMTRAQILQQAGTSMLAQANQIPQTVLSLLQ